MVSSSSFENVIVLCGRVLLFLLTFSACMRFSLYSMIYFVCVSSFRIFHGYQKK